MEEKVLGGIDVKEDFDENLHEQRYPQAKSYFAYLADFIPEEKEVLSSLSEPLHPDVLTFPL
jgi:hypothetical protein